MEVPQPDFYAGADRAGWMWNSLGWARALVASLAKQDQGLIALPRVTLARLPAADRSRGVMVVVLDESGGEVPAWSDGTNWRRVTDRAVVS
jgi:hypothetical protein